MKKILLDIGSVFFIGGTILFGIIHLAIANYVPNMGGWSNPPGKFSMAAEETMTFFPYILSILFMIIGILLLVLGYKNAKKG